MFDMFGFGGMGGRRGREEEPRTADVQIPVRVSLRQVLCITPRLPPTETVF